MAYYIFLKSLRRLEEFRKNPHVKIPHKSPSTNFQSLGKFKNPIFIRKEFSSEFSPLGPAGLPTPTTMACRPAQAIQPLPGPNRPAHLASQPLGPLVPLAYFTADVFLIGSPLRRPTSVGIFPTPRMPPSLYNPPSSLPPS
jgi:hypothetical protein